jgi:hypothetical protein
VLAESQLPDGNWALTLKAIVSISKLSKFVEAKGGAIEIKGDIFALNIEQQLLNEKGEVNVISEMVGLLHEPMQISFDYEIKSSEPKSIDAEESNIWEIPFEVIAKANNNLAYCADYFIKTLTAVSLSTEEVQIYKSLNKQVFPITVVYKNQQLTYYFRKKRSTQILNLLGMQWGFYVSHFKVKSDLDNKNGISDAANFKSDVVEFYDFNNSKFIFPLLGNMVANFKWSHTKTLSEIKKMSGYSVEPLGVTSEFKHGGIVVYENNREGMVLGVVDLGVMGMPQSDIACNELVLNGYHDWRLPTLDEFQNISNNLWQNKLLGNEKYWTSTKSESQNIIVEPSGKGIIKRYYGYERAQTRPIRHFTTNASIDSNDNDENISAKPNSLDKSLKSLEAYVGNYVAKKHAEYRFEISISEEKLYLKFISGFNIKPLREIEMFKGKFDQFYDPYKNVKVQFKRNSKGEVNSLIFTDTNINGHVEAFK